MFSLGTFNLIYIRKKLSKIKGYDKELKIVKSIQENLILDAWQGSECLHKILQSSTQSINENCSLLVT